MVKENLKFASTLALAACSLSSLPLEAEAYGHYWFAPGSGEHDYDAAPTYRAQSDRRVTTQHLRSVWVRQATVTSADDVSNLPTTHAGTSAAVAQPAVSAATDVRRDGLLFELSELRKLKDGWDGEGSVAPNPAAINNAVTMAQLWPRILRMPVADADCDGRVSLDVYDDDELSLGTVSFDGQDNVARLTMVDKTRVLETRPVNLNSLDDINAALSAVATHWA